MVRAVVEDTEDRLSLKKFLNNAVCVLLSEGLGGRETELDFFVGFHNYYKILRAIEYRWGCLFMVS